MENNSPLVSVIIPTYKRSNLIERGVDSVLSQTYKNIEIIVVDDNGVNTEEGIKTKNIMAQFANNNKIKYLQHLENKGGSAARNSGWKNCNGYFITFFDDDDIMAPTKIEKQVKCLIEKDITWGACYTGYELIQPNGTKQRSSENRSGNCYIDALMRTMFMGSGSNLLLRKMVVDEIGGYDESFTRNQDIEFMVRVFEKYKLAYIDENLLTIRQDDNRKPLDFDSIENVTKFYLSKFSDRINVLEPKVKKKVLSVISLERFRTSIYSKRIWDGIKILSDNKVNFGIFLKYCLYIINRIITNKSYGFRG